MNEGGSELRQIILRRYIDTMIKKLKLSEKIALREFFTRPTDYYRLLANNMSIDALTD